MYVMQEIYFGTPSENFLTVYGFDVKVGMHQGSALSQLLFMTVKEAIYREFRVALPWKLLYADELAVIAVTEQELNKSLNEWKESMESKGIIIIIILFAQ